jgi:hypothetical protein
MYVLAIPKFEGGIVLELGMHKIVLVEEAKPMRQQPYWMNNMSTYTESQTK